MSLKQRSSRLARQLKTHRGTIAKSALGLGCVTTDCGAAGTTEARHPTVSPADFGLHPEQYQTIAANKLANQTIEAKNNQSSPAEAPTDRCPSVRGMHLVSLPLFVLLAWRRTL
jgi:hypothetical protein